MTSFAGYGLAVLAAACNAVSNVLQRKANREAPAELSMRPRLLLDLLHRKTWLAGMITVILSFLLMAAALSMGRLAAVQPIVVMELPLTLLLGSRVLGARLTAREWVASGAMTVGLAGLLAALAPSAGNNGAAPGLSWAIGAATSVALLGVVVGAGLRSHGGARAALLGVATGVTFGLTAAFMKGMTASFHDGVTGVLGAWQTYAMVAAGLSGMFLMQNALHAGSLVVAQPGITLADPAVAIVWGVFIFDETTRGGIYVIGAVVAAAVMAGGVIVLARSPALEPGLAPDGGCSGDVPVGDRADQDEGDGRRASRYPRRVSASST